MITYGLIGYPLIHSGSQLYFTEKFRKENIPGRQYKLFPLTEITQLKDLLLENPDISGLNVTIPYKEKVLPLMNSLDPVAKITGAVNTIKITRANNSLFLSGYNSDAAGFKNSIHLKEYKNALILGTGGASKAVAFVLKNAGINYLFVTRGNDDQGKLTYSGLTKEITRKHTLIINATPQGMYPEISSYANIPYQYLTRDHFLYDLVYNPPETEFLRKGRSMGAKVQNGLKMLYQQAELSYRIWEKDLSKDVR